MILGCDDDVVVVFVFIRFALFTNDGIDLGNELDLGTPRNLRIEGSFSFVVDVAVSMV